MVRRALLVPTLLVWGLRAGAASAEAVRPHEHAIREHVVVRISGRGIEPSTKSAGSNQAIVWLNYGRFPVRISLEGSAATRLHGREPAHFRSSEWGGLMAARVDPMGSASLCLLEQGIYRYVVEEVDPLPGSTALVPGGRRLEGRLVIGQPPADSPEAQLQVLVRHHRVLADLHRELALAREQLAIAHESQGLQEAAGQARARAEAASRLATEHAREVQRYERALEAPP